MRYLRQFVSDALQGAFFVALMVIAYVGLRLAGWS